MKKILSILLFLLSLNVFSEKKEIWLIDSTGTVLEKQFIETTLLQSADDAPNPLFKLFRKKHKDHRKLIAAVLAFPFPFGIVGLHRIFLGTKPYVPVVYIATLGGIFGILLSFAAVFLIRSFVVGLEPVIDLKAVLLSMIFSLLVGILFGIYPAIKAAELDPIEALRYQ